MADRKPFKFVVTDGDPRQPRTGANITNETNVSTAPSAAEVAEQEMRKWVAAAENRKAYEEAKAASKQSRTEIQTRWLSICEIK